MDPPINPVRFMIGHPEFGELGDHSVPQVVEPKPRQARGVPERTPGGVPLQHRLRGIVASPLAGRPKKVIGLGVAEQIGALQHPRNGLDGRRVEGNHTVARLVLAATNVDELLHEIDVAPAEVLNLHRPPRCVRRDDGGAIHVLPLCV
jgi:hypothetical protein